MDRRIVKTKQSLQDALLALLREQPFEQIEIQAITDRANTARVTFYRHYGTKEELLLDVLEQVYDLMRHQFTFESLEQILEFRHQPPVQKLFVFLEQDRVLYKKLLMGTASALIQHRLRRYIVEQIVSKFSTAPRYAELPIILIANQVASTVIGNIMWWLGDDLDYSADYMAQITHKMSWFGAMALVGRSEDIISER